MAKNKKKASAAKRAQPPAKKKGMSVTGWVAMAAAIVAVVVAVVVIGSNGGTGAAAGAQAATAAGTAAASTPVSAEEAKYVGRLLPAKYTEQSVAAASTYSSSIAMTNITPSQGAKQTTIKVADLVADKIVYFEYQKAGGDPIPMIAYVKPSGKLFVGVSFCPPCKGKQQTIEGDGTLRCAACGTKRDLETGAGVSGACRRYPIDEVPATVTGGNIVIQNSVLDGWTAQPLDRPVGA